MPIGPKRTRLLCLFLCTAAAFAGGLVASRPLLAGRFDPYPRFMDPEEYDRLKRETEGDTEITGIGIDLERRKRGLVVVSPIEGSPAWRAGIEPGDAIVRIDGTDADSLEWE